MRERWGKRMLLIRIYVDGLLLLSGSYFFRMVEEEAHFIRFSWASEGSDCEGGVAFASVWGGWAALKGEENKLKSVMNLYANLGMKRLDF